MCALRVLDTCGLVKNFSAFDCCSKHAPRTANREAEGNRTERRRPEGEGGRGDRLLNGGLHSTFAGDHMVENKADRTRRRHISPVLLARDGGK